MKSRVSMLLKSRASLTYFRVRFLPGRAKDLSAPLYILLIIENTTGLPHIKIKSLLCYESVQIGVYLPRFWRIALPPSSGSEVVSSWTSSVLKTPPKFWQRFISQGHVQNLREHDYENTPLTHNEHCSGRTTTLTSKCFILYIYSTNIGTEYFKHGIYSPCFYLQNAVFS